MTTRLVLVTVFRRKTLYFGDETCSRHRFRRKTLYFGDEPRSRRRFEVKNALFWRRESNSSPF
ncbi:hypothetical protein NSQ82_05500 [Caldifermentibacillus hisashii]|uniref:hypothetical protein n=1 Tax=Caldifermentibacillus hisashii TaxID=996558 RepID=UPI0031B72452